MSKLAKTILILVILAAVAGGVYAWQKQNVQHLVSNTTDVPNSVSKTSATDTVDTTSWQMYKNDEYGFEFKYPAILSVKEINGTVILEHSVPYNHGDPCNVRYGGSLEKLTDFYVSIQLSDMSLGDALRINNPPLYKYSWKDGELKLSEGYINEDSLGTLKGYRINSSVEMCGGDEYYFPTSQESTFIVWHSYITELMGISATDYQKYLKLPDTVSPADIIFPEEGVVLFQGIFSTFKFTK